MPEYDWTDGFRLLDGETLADVMSFSADVARHTEKIVSDLPDLGVPLPATQPGAPWIPAGLVWSPRWVLLHLIEETARHAGHADIVRESLDGATCWTLMAAAEGWPEQPWGNSPPAPGLHQVCRLRCGLTSRAPGAPSASTGSTRRCSEFAHGDEVTVEHRAFELDPRAPARRSETMTEMLTKKYGMSPDQIHAGHERLTSLGREVGMDFAFERIQPGNTFDAHRLTQAVRGTDREEKLVKALFSAYFTEGNLLSDHRVLLEAARAAGVDPDVAAAVLAGDDHAAGVRADETAAQELGITGVPHFLINDRWAIPGAQDLETLVLVLNRAWERSEGLEQAGAPTA